MAGLLFVVMRLIYTNCCRTGKKSSAHHDPSLPFQPPRRPTAVRSPSGQPTHYLKKSPSPNGTKPLPGTSALLSPNGASESLPATPITHPQTALTGGFPATGIKYTEENELSGQQRHDHHLSNGGGIGGIGVNNFSTKRYNTTTNNALPPPQQPPMDDGTDGGSSGTVDTFDAAAASSAVKPAAEYGKLGSLVFKLHYLTERSALVVSVVRCRGLPGKSVPQMQPDQAQPQQTGTSAAQNNNTNARMMTLTVNGNGTCAVAKGGSASASSSASSGSQATDPYVKLQLLPDKQHKVKTRVVRNTRNPVYDEDFTFYGLSLAELSLMSLHFVVLSFDRYSRDDVIGEVVCPLSSIDLSQIENQQVALSKEIQPRSLKIRAQGRGELLTSLCWQPAASRLTVVMLKARNLPRMDVTGLADPYVKIYLLFNGQRIAKKKTHVKKRTLSPVFNESFAFDIPMVEVSRVVEILMEIFYYKCDTNVCISGNGCIS